MCENWRGQENSALLQGLALCFVDRHSPRQTYWELSAPEDERKFRRPTSEGYPWEQIPLSRGAAREDPHIQQPAADGQDQAAAAIAYT